MAAAILAAIHHVFEAVNWQSALYTKMTKPGMSESSWFLLSLLTCNSVRMYVHCNMKNVMSSYNHWEASHTSKDNTPTVSDDSSDV